MPSVPVAVSHGVTQQNRSCHGSGRTLDGVAAPLCPGFAVDVIWRQVNKTGGRRRWALRIPVARYEVSLVKTAAVYLIAYLRAAYVYCRIGLLPPMAEMTRE